MRSSFGLWKADARGADVKELEDAIYADVGAAMEVLDSFDVCGEAPPELVREIARRARSLREALERVPVYSSDSAMAPSSGSTNSS